MQRRHFLAGMGGAAGLLPACQSGALAVKEAGAEAGAEASAAALRGEARGTLLDAAALEDGLVGSSYLGCGGGGRLDEARALIAADLAEGLVFRALDVAELADDERVASPYGLGSLAPLGEDLAADLAAVDPPVDAPTLDAFRLLERHLETRFSGVILGEIGPVSMAEGLSIAARLGIPALDADTVGRATPEINQHSVRVAGYPLTPAAAVTPFGDEVILDGVRDPARQEAVFRALSVVSGVVGVTDGPIDGAAAKADGTLVKGSFTLARAIGAAVRKARASGGDPIEAARAAGDGYTLFEGRVARFDWGDRDGFLAGDVELAGRGANAGERLHLDYKNEHLVARLGGPEGAVIATCPDLITVIDEATHEGISNPDFTEGQAVRVLGYRCDPIWRRPAGLAVFEPRYFGYDIDYVPIEQRNA
ncbi:MAG: DUF917 domain-containing protein [Pseudomonadota bacterium]